MEAVDKRSPVSSAAPEEVHDVDDQRVAVWLLVAFVSNTTFGAYPVFTRYLQSICHIPPFLLIALSNSPGLVLLAPVLLARRREIQWRSIVRNRYLVPTCLFIVTRSMTLVVASYFTTAVNIQVIALLAPFLVAFASHFFLKEAIPRYSIGCSILCLIGAIVTVIDDFEVHAAETHALGIFLAVVSLLCLVAYMICLRAYSKGIAGKASEGAAIMLFHYSAIIVTGFIFSAGFQESWHPWSELSEVGWSIFWMYAILVLIIGNVTQVYSVGKVGATLVSALLPWRLVVTVVLSIFLLGEGLSSVYDIVGATVVLLSVLAYLILQQRLAWKRIQARRDRAYANAVPELQPDTPSDSSMSPAVTVITSPEIVETRATDDKPQPACALDQENSADPDVQVTTTTIESMDAAETVTVDPEAIAVDCLATASAEPSDRAPEEELEDLDRQIEQALAGVLLNHAPKPLFPTARPTTWALDGSGVSPMDVEAMDGRPGDRASEPVLQNVSSEFELSHDTSPAV